MRLETLALNTKENISHSLSILSREERSVLFISSGYLGRRVDLYLKKMKTDGVLDEGRKYFIVDADVREDAEMQILTSEQLRRKEESILYESIRIVEYRRKGDL